MKILFNVEHRLKQLEAIISGRDLSDERQRELVLHAAQVLLSDVFQDGVRAYEKALREETDW